MEGGPDSLDPGFVDRRLSDNFTQRLADASADLENAKKGMQAVGVSQPEVSLVQAEQTSQKAIDAENNAIRSDHITIMALEGHNKSVFEYLGEEEGSHRIAWQSEPHPDFAIKATNHSQFAHEIMLISNPDELWKIFETTTKQIAQETGYLPDLEFLSPYEAVYIIGEVLRRNIKYDHLLTVGDKKNLSVGKAIDLIGKTKRDDIVGMVMARNPSGLEEFEKYQKRMYRIPAEKIIQEGSGVCGHIAITASAMYEAVKNKQKGLRMNGTYLVYHDESRGLEENWAAIGNHAYNILVVTSPNTNQSETENVSMSVIDYTHERNKEMDFTWRRASQAVGLVQAMGKDLGIKDYKKEVEQLADKLLFKYPAEEFKYSDIDLNEYAALLAISSYQSGERVVGRLVNLLKSQGYPTPTVFEKIVDLPIMVNKQDGGRKIIKQGYIGEMARELNDYSYSQVLDGGEAAKKILKVITDTIDDSYIYIVKDLLKGHKGIKDYGDFAIQAMRLAVETGELLSKDTASIIKTLVTTYNRLEPEIVPSDLVERFNKLPKI